MEWRAEWIWIDKEKQPVNAQVCFRKTFHIDKDKTCKAILNLSADTVFRVWVNGVEIGDGPIRSTSDHWFYERYDIAHMLLAGSNTLAIAVWHYGHSNYQYVENQAGLIAQLELTDFEGQSQWVITDNSWKTHRHEGYERHVVKRNVNIGWLEVYDAGGFDEGWISNKYDDQVWSSAHSICLGGAGAWGELFLRDIEPFSKQLIYPRQLVSESEVRPVRQVVSVQMREQFFPGNRDANAKIFTGYFGTALEVQTETKGTMTFAHSPWNGLQGRFRIDGQWYTSGDEIHLTKGRHLFLVELSGVYNDVFSHMEWNFDTEIAFVHPIDDMQDEQISTSSFVTWGPFQSIEAKADGYHPVYGGVEKRSGLDKDMPAFVEAGQVDSLQALQRYKHELKTVPAEGVMLNQMIYSLMLRKEVLASYAIKRERERMIYNHEQPTVVELPSHGGDREFVIDFGKLYVGQVLLDIDADAGTVFDIYGFEAIVDGRIRYTSGLNNAFRYTAKEGRQSYKSVSRMGFRYLMITIRNQTGPVSIYRTAVQQSGYPVTDQAVFRCSDPLLNDIWEISRHTSEVCTEDTFVDCPTFERVFWVGDCRVSALVNYYLFGSYELVKHCLELVPRSRDKSELLLSCLPTDWQSVIPMWTFSWMIACKDYIEYSGDTAFIEQIYPEYERALQAYCEFLNEDDLFDISSWNLVDWADMDIPYVGIGTAQHAALAYCCQIGADLAERLEKKETAEQWRAVAQRMRTALTKHLWSEEKQAFIDGRYRTGEDSTSISHQTHVLLYLFEALDGEWLAKIEKELVNPPEEWVQIISPFMSFYLFEVWHDMGRLDLILERIRKVWGAMIRQGSTTAWETYPNTRSFAHAWSAAPAYVLGKHLLGVERKSEGFSTIQLQPPQTELSWAEGSIPTPYGRIDVSWAQEDNLKKLTLCVPEAIEVLMEATQTAGWTVELKRVL